MIRITFKKTTDSRTNAKHPDYIDFDGTFPGLQFDLPLEATEPSSFAMQTGIHPNTVAKMIRSGHVPSIVWNGKPFVVGYKMKFVLNAPDDLPAHYEDLGAWIATKFNSEQV